MGRVLLAIAHIWYPRSLETFNHIPFFEWWRYTSTLSPNAFAVLKVKTLIPVNENSPNATSVHIC